MRYVNVFFLAAVLAVLGAGTTAAQQTFGAQGAEGEPNRLQQWLVPSPDLAHPAHAVLFRPAGDGPFPLASRQLADAFRTGGGKVDFRVLAAYGSEGHWLPETEGGVKSAASELDRALKPRSPNAANKR